MKYRASKLFLRAVPVAFKRVSGAILTSVYKRAAKVAGKGLRIGSGVYISHPESISFGDNVLIEGPARFSSEVNNSSLVFCDGVQINRDVFLDFSGGLTLGVGVLISEGAMVYTHDHQLDPPFAAQSAGKKNWGKCLDRRQGDHPVRLHRNRRWCHCRGRGRGNQECAGPFHRRGKPGKTYPDAEHRRIACESLGPASLWLCACKLALAKKRRSQVCRRWGTNSRVRWRSREAMAPKPGSSRWNLVRAGILTPQPRRAYFGTIMNRPERSGLRLPPNSVN